MKRIFTRLRFVFLLVFFLFSISNNELNAQCNNGLSYGSVAAPASGSVTTIATDQWQGDYSTISGVAVVAQGFAPLEWTAAVAGNHYVHYNTNAACGTASNDRRSTIGRSVNTTSCSTTFTDLNGGSNYGNNQTMIWKFFPSTPGE